MLNFVFSKFFWMLINRQVRIENKNLTYVAVISKFITLNFLKFIYTYYYVTISLQCKQYTPTTPSTITFLERKTKN